ncbi:MAG TPA: hypothetical protein VFF06_11305 [Polyangia bacterium]|nr:hypothetical protein [Polyangia bacterium]
MLSITLAAACSGSPVGSGGCAGDLGGTPLQICGMPDASFSPSQCACVGDP